MNVFRKIMGLLLIVFVGLPLLFGIIWAVGLTKAVVSPEFVSDFPQEIIREVPRMIDSVFEEAKDEDVISDSNTRAWFEAAARTDVSPRELMERIGLLDWMNHELSDLLDDVGAILRGTRRARNLIVDLRPLKDALQHEEFYNYLRNVLDHLPSCNEAELEKWERSVWSGADWFDRPACRPDQATYEAIIEDVRDEIVYDIPNEISILENVRFFPLGISRVVTWLSYALFLIPALVIFLASLVAATSPASFFRWSGISVFLGGLSGMLMSLLTGQAARWAVFFRPYSNTWSTDLQNLVIDKTEWIQLAVIDHLFSPVLVVAGAVCVVGIILFALSLIARSQKPSVSSTQPVPFRQESAKPKTFDSPSLGTDEPESNLPDKSEAVEKKTDEPQSNVSEDPEEDKKD
jgi:uncharacterized membrane protein YgdD (TMEM256/DUF423 family)